jgi:hypothetical protein
MISSNWGLPGPNLIPHAIKFQPRYFPPETGDFLGHLVVAFFRALAGAWTERHLSRRSAPQKDKVLTGGSTAIAIPLCPSAHQYDAPAPVRCQDRGIENQMLISPADAKRLQ